MILRDFPLNCALFALGVMTCVIVIVNNSGKPPENPCNPRSWPHIRTRRSSYGQRKPSFPGVGETQGRSGWDWNDTNRWFRNLGRKPTVWMYKTPKLPCQLARVSSIKSQQYDIKTALSGDVEKLLTSEFLTSNLWKVIRSSFKNWKLYHLS